MNRPYRNTLFFTLDSSLIIIYLLLISYLLLLTSYFSYANPVTPPDWVQAYRAHSAATPVSVRRT